MKKADAALTRFDAQIARPKSVKHSPTMGWQTLAAVRYSTMRTKPNTVTAMDEASMDLNLGVQCLTVDRMAQLDLTTTRKPSPNTVRATKITATLQEILTHDGYAHCGIISNQHSNEQNTQHKGSP
jgi:hypothetical protein